ncbi:hypothetical protein OIU77_011405 [Salix suchowensis]|uniref:Uncharacterized protein n=1 Tax=Salix suchowensis TaxID=1278906 RepID=A0ABQ9A073_9ROSI|nr:hypothetical protein OIU77_011405 [Salix suchowensis]
MLQVFHETRTGRLADSTNYLFPFQGAWDCDLSVCVQQKHSQPQKSILCFYGIYPEVFLECNLYIKLTRAECTMSDPGWVHVSAKKICFFTPLSLTKCLYFMC